MLTFEEKLHLIDILQVRAKAKAETYKVCGDRMNAALYEFAANSYEQFLKIFKDKNA